MARTYKYKREEIIEEAYNLVKEDGVDHLTARELGKRLDSSSKIIFGSFKNMDDLKEEVIEYGYSKYSEKMKEALRSTRYKGYISCGLAYISIAKEEPNIFKMLFMRDTTNERKVYTDSSINLIYEIISSRGNITIEEAKDVTNRYWFVMHGIATSIATNFMNLDDEYIIELLKDNFESIIKNIKEKKGILQ